MLEIKCPHCGKRSQNEFAYGGDATIKRPKLGEEVSTKDWDDFVYFKIFLYIIQESVRIKLELLQIFYV